MQEIAKIYSKENYLICQETISAWLMQALYKDE